MDGGGRLLRSIEGAGTGALAEVRPRFAGPFAVWNGFSAAPAVTRRRQPRAPGTRRPGRPGLGLMLGAVLFGVTGAFGAVRGGAYQVFVDQNGSLPDLLAKTVGFSIQSVVITGLKELSPHEILTGADVTPKNSLAFLDPAALRDRLLSLPLVKDATVRKLFPSDLAVTVTERVPAGLWQNGGQISLIAADGVPIDDVKDDRFNGLPFVVGVGANTRLDEFNDLLEAAGDLKPKVRAGVLVGERRWTLKLDSGLEVQLPEIGAPEALGRLADLEREHKVLEKDIIWLDLRVPGRLTVRLSEDAAAQRAEAMAKKPKKANAT